MLIPPSPGGQSRSTTEIISGIQKVNEVPDNEASTVDDASLRVDCYSGHRGDSEPRRLHFGQRAVAVTEIIDRWLDPSHRYFKLRGDDGGIYLLRHDSSEDRWQLTLYDSGRRVDTMTAPTGASSGGMRGS
jgi:hypothetical protein